MTQPAVTTDGHIYFPSGWTQQQKQEWIDAENKVRRRWEQLTGIMMVRLHIRMEAKEQAP